MEDYYKIFNIEQNATKEEIKKQFRNYYGTNSYK